MANENSFLIYQDDNGISNVNVRFEGEDVWLTTDQMEQLFQASRQDVAYHIKQFMMTRHLLMKQLAKNFC